MSASLHALDAEITCVVEGSVVLRLHEGELIEHSLAVTRAIHEQLSARVESNQEIFVAIMAGLDEVGQSVAGAPHFVPTHRTGNIEEDSDRHRGIGIAKEGDLLGRLLVNNRESVLAKARNKPPIDISHRHIKGNQVSVGDNGILRINVTLR